MQLGVYNLKSGQEVSCVSELSWVVGLSQTVLRFGYMVPCNWTCMPCKACLPACCSMVGMHAIWLVHDWVSCCLKLWPGHHWVVVAGFGHVAPMHFTGQVLS